MKKTILPKSNSELWRLIGTLNHTITLLRHKELRQNLIPIRQYGILATINDLGPKATLSEMANQADRKYSVISRQVIKLERDGLIKRTKVSGSNLLKLELTEKGKEMVKFAHNTQSIDVIFSVLSDEERQQLSSIVSRMLFKARKINY